MRRIYVVGTADTKGEELAFLAGHAAGSIPGAMISVDGGWSAR